jgi:hypothetical protein
MAGMLYSKYHGALVIGLVVISNFRLLRSYKFWISGILAILILSPHILWQVENDYPSFRYHLFDRSDEFKWRYLLEYIPNQLAVFNPLILGAAFYSITKVKPGDLFTRAMYFLIAGFIGFFGLTAFRGHVEPHWTISCAIAIIILLYNNSISNSGMKRFLHKAIFPSFLIILICRILLVTDNPLVRTFGFRGKAEKYKYIGSVAKDMPVLFMGSFQGPSLYWFHTGKECTAVSNIFQRRTQFDIWQTEDRFYNKQAFIVGDIGGRSEIYEKGDIKFAGFVTDSLQNISRIGLKILSEQKVIRSGDSLAMNITISNPYQHDIDFDHRKFPVNLFLVLLNGKEIYMSDVIPEENIGVIRSGDTIRKNVRAKVPELPKGTYSLGICLNTILGPAANGSFKKVKVVTK